MKSCVICNRGNGAGSPRRFLDDVILNEADRGTLRARLEGVLNEAVRQDGWVCAACQAELKRIETYYTLINDFKQQYWDTRKVQQTQEPDGHDTGRQAGRVQLGDHTYNAGVRLQGRLQGRPLEAESINDSQQGSVSDTDQSENDEEENESGESAGGTYKQGAKDCHKRQTGLKGRQSSTKEQHARHASPREGAHPRDKTLPRAEKTQSVGSVRPYVCAACDVGFTQPRSLSTHIREAHTPHLAPTPSGRYVCNFCSKVHSTACQLVRHVRVHTGDKPYKCGVCLKVYTELCHLKDHMGLHSAHRFPCPVCHRLLGTKHSLQGHVARMHGRRVTFSPATSRLKRYKLNYTKTDVVEVAESDERPPGGEGDTLTIKEPTGEAAHTEGEKQPEELQLNERGLQVSDVYPVYVSGQGYVCSVCNKSFRWPAQYERHARVHTGERRHRCTVCGRGYKEASHLKSHMDTHGGYVFSCPVCGREHGTHVSLRLHMTKSHHGVPIPRAGTFRQPQQQQRTTTTSEATHEDSRAAETVPTTAASKLKQQQESPNQPESSSQRPAVFKIKDYYEKKEAPSLSKCEQEPADSDSKQECVSTEIGLDMDVTEELSSVMAEDSEEVSISQSEMVLYAAVIDNDAEDRTLTAVVIDNDNKDTVTAVVIDNEEENRTVSAVSGAVETGSQTKCHVCWECGKRFRNRIELTRHGLVHTGLRPHQCGTCGKTYKHISHLNTHMQTHGSLTFLCTTCGLTMSTKTGLNHHMRQHQEGGLRGRRAEKPLISRSHTCPQCDKVYVSARNLAVHSRTHRGERPYSCAVCSRTFTTQSCLTQHMARHSDSRPYSCPQCGKGFKYRAQIKVHQKVHTREVCTECGKRCRDHASLINHQRSHVDSSTGSTYLPLPQEPGQPLLLCPLTL